VIDAQGIRLAAIREVALLVAQAAAANHRIFAMLDSASEEDKRNDRDLEDIACDCAGTLYDIYAKARDVQIRLMAADHNYVDGWTDQWLKKLLPWYLKRKKREKLDPKADD
jgi:hypothetical protein